MTNMSFQEAVEQIKERLDIVEVIQNRVVLKKHGANYMGLCPFHNEKTPSFVVSPKKQIFKCFGCGASGDVFSFLMKISSQTFFEMVKEQSQMVGIELPKSFNDEHKDIKEDLIKAMEDASEFYQKNLYNTPKAYEYLSARGLSEEVIKKYRLGYAPSSIDALQEAIKKDNRFESMVQAGLILEREAGGYLDRFRSRIMIPIINEKGSTVAFGARAVLDGQNPKYINSPDTKIYNKSNILYGLYQAQEAIKQEDSVVIMEGYFDVISAQASGVKNAVASCGTALTEHHVRLISRYTPSRRIYLNFDTDKAGQKATELGANTIKEVFSALGDIKQYDDSFSNSQKACEIRVISPPQGKDPDQYIREIGAAAYKEQLEHAPLLLDYQIDNIFKDYNPDSPREKSVIVDNLVKILKEIENPIIQGEYIKTVCRRADVREDAILSLLAKNEIKTVFKAPVLQTNVKKNENILKKGQKIFLSLYIVADDEEKINSLKQMVENEDFEDLELLKIKTAIDKILCQVNNVSDLAQKLFLEFSEDEETKSVITDIIYMSEPFGGLVFSDFATVIFETKQKMKRYHATKLKDEFKKRYHKNNLDDEQAIKIQMELKDTLSTKHTFGDF